MGVIITGTNDNIKAADGSLSIEGFSIKTSGIGTFDGGVQVGTAATIHSNGNLGITGIMTASSYVGDGSALTGVASTEISNSDFAVGVSTFFVDYSTGNVGVGTITPTSGDGHTLEVFDVTCPTFRLNDGTQYKALMQLRGNDLEIRGSSGTIEFYNGNADGASATERARFDPNGRLLVGHNDNETMFYTGNIQVQGTNSSTSAITIKTNQNDSGGPAFVLGKSRGSIGGQTVVQSGDELGSIYFAGADGTDTNSRGAAIRCNVDGTPGSNDMPGRLLFLTTADGASTETERMRITSAGYVGVGTDTPNSIFEVCPTLNVGVGINNTGGAALIDFRANGVLEAAQIRVDESSGGGYFQIKSKDTGGTARQRLVIDVAGNTGINTGSGINYPLKIDCNGSSGTDLIALHLNNTAGSDRARPGIAFGSRGSVGAYAARIYGGPNSDNAGHGDLVFQCANNSGTQNTMLYLHGKSYSDGKIQATPGGGGFQILGALSKSSGSFRIPHPLAGLSTTKDLVHSFIEGPQADLIYRGVSTLSAGTSTVNIDTAGRMTEGTFAALVNNVSCFTSNETDWKAVKGSVSGNVLTISCEDNTSTATVSWLVVGERCDAHMISTETSWTDNNGRVITEVDQDPPLS